MGFAFGAKITWNQRREGFLGTLNWFRFKGKITWNWYREGFCGALKGSKGLLSWHASQVISATGNRV